MAHKSLEYDTSQAERTTVPWGARTDATAGEKIVSVPRTASNDGVCEVTVSDMYEACTMVRVCRALHSTVVD
jgi:hypothetical protein